MKIASKENINDKDWDMYIVIKIKEIIAENKPKSNPLLIIYYICIIYHRFDYLENSIVINDHNFLSSILNLSNLDLNNKNLTTLFPILYLFVCSPVNPIR